VSVRRSVATRGGEGGADYAVPVGQGILFSAVKRWWVDMNLEWGFELPSCASPYYIPTHSDSMTVFAEILTGFGLDAYGT